ncbi:Uma2 family endonuclease [Desulfofundulus thermosubterraneus]|uniref:Endonuclease, Uma2 family (Restriction endonuclease fold) n=1 Tax=Desulfofundulus thermosubterraneus DSM 16057 TaxID=1121432 RepID=A0A1M6MG36_9FIRM|nr:Uma2 family endonuclease [Desulfofundulus thermosubterraneus]SHJ82445.1 Endonuclease, Uma2 family (restriction endonuclease fold) [Desulfofundulus thermosubterraneus DSM 16057]
MSLGELKMTYREYLQLPEDKRYELIGGRLYMVPAPSVIHQMVLENLGYILNRHVREKKRGVVLRSPIDVYLTEEDVVQPDIIFISQERRYIIGEANIRGGPDLVIEVLSPSTAAIDQTVKKELYRNHGVREVWYVHPVAQTIEICTFTPEGEKKELYARHDEKPFVSAVLPGLQLDLNKVF